MDPATFGAIASESQRRENSALSFDQPNTGGTLFWGRNLPTSTALLLTSTGIAYFADSAIDETFHSLAPSSAHSAHSATASNLPSRPQSMTP